MSLWDDVLTIFCNHDHPSSTTLACVHVFLMLFRVIASLDHRTALIINIFVQQESSLGPQKRSKKKY